MAAESWRPFDGEEEGGEPTAAPADVATADDAFHVWQKTTPRLLVGESVAAAPDSSPFNSSTSLGSTPPSPL